MNTIKLITTKEKLFDLYNHVKENYQHIKEDSVYTLSEYSSDYISLVVYVDWYSGNRYCFEFNTSDKPCAATIIDLQRYDFELLLENRHTVRGGQEGEKATTIIMLTTGE